MFPPLAEQTYTAHTLHITHQRMGNKSRQGVNCWVFWNIYQSHCQHLPRARWIREVLGEYTTLGKELTLRHKQNNHKHEAWWYHRILFCLDLKKRWHGIPSKREVRESKSLTECSWWNGPTLLPCRSSWLTPQDLVQETISDGINSFVLTFSTATKPSKSTPLHYSKVSCLISTTSTTIDYAILLSMWD